VGDTPLDSWLRARELSRYAFAKQLNVSPRSVILWCNNQSLPDLVNAFRIQQATEGGVTPEMWLGTDLARFLWERESADWEKQRARGRKDNRKRYIKKVPSDG
jgi:plasmid maintenance system antidote protein VapI